MTEKKSTFIVLRNKWDGELGDKTDQLGACCFFFSSNRFGPCFCFVNMQKKLFFFKRKRSAYLTVMALFYSPCEVGEDI